MIDVFSLRCRSSFLVSRVMQANSLAPDCFLERVAQGSIVRRGARCWIQISRTNQHLLLTFRRSHRLRGKTLDVSRL